MFRPSRDLLIGFLLVCAAAWGLMGTRALRFADQGLYDAQVRWLRANASTPMAQDVVVIGIDEAAYEAIPEPTALWHAHLGALLAGLSSAQPAVVGLAMPLPVRSYDFLVKDIDSMLLAGIYRLKGAVPLVVGQPRGVEGHLRPIAPELLAAIGTGAVASLKEHPLPRFLEAGIKVALCTDNPTVSSTSLSREYELAMETFGFSEDDMRAIASMSCRGTFLGAGCPEAGTD